MARITYQATSIGGDMVAQAVDHLVQAQTLLNRAVALANSITGGGATPANLEGSTEFNVATSQGSTFYTAINNMKTNAATITASALADLDQG